ncbi:hypothetical protein BSKO_09683 [Bryopsis sp. KO-2023]|nr:hypothetical protein BSKO_09683 [Bryopsis sp. KO-2023]
MWKWVQKQFLCCFGVEEESVEVEASQTETYKVVEVELPVAEESYPSHIFSDISISSLSCDAPPTPHTTPAFPWVEDEAIAAEMMDNGLQCQSTWLFLEPVFGLGCTVKQIPEEGEKLGKVNGIWRETVAATDEDSHAIRIAREKECLFPRFFFLSNDEMLEILSETENPHAKKCFEGVAELHFKKNVINTSIKSVEQEQVPFENLVDTVEAAMFESVQNTTAIGIENCAAKHRNNWVLERSGMVAVVVPALYWTQGVAIQEKCVKEYEEFCTQDMLKNVDSVLGKLTELQRTTLGNKDQIRIFVAHRIQRALVVLDVHARDVVTTLAAKGIDNIADFERQAQLRSYWNEDKSAEKDFSMLKCVMWATLEYGYEDLGNSSRLVITPQTDRYYRTLLGAIHLTLEEAPEWPAGTGKTETTKDLAKSFARQCVLFNWADSLDYIAMGKFFKVLASSGAWECFDAFNRIDLEALGVVAQQELSPPVFAATWEVYFTAMSQLLPTPAKSDCTSNLGDISRVGNGLLMMKPLGKKGSTKDLCLRLGNHEILQVFYDRLVDEKHQQWFLSALKQTTATSLNADFDKLFKHVANEANIPDAQSTRRCFLGDYKNQEAEEPSLGSCSEVIDIAPLISKMEECLVDHKSTSKQAMNLAMFLYAVKHVSRVCRVLKQPEVSDNHKAIVWRDDLQKMTRRAGGACVFLSSDTQIKGESFVEEINCLLHAGEFSSLVNCCRVECFQRWSTDALEGGAMKSLQEIENMTKEEGLQIMNMCKMFPQDIVGLSDKFRSQAGRINYVTPTSYLELITTFAALLAQKGTEISAAKKRCEMGLEKLEFTVKQVNIMQNEPTALKPTLAKMVSKTGQLMATVQKGKTVVSTSSPLAFWSPVTVSETLFETSLQPRLSFTRHPPPSLTDGKTKTSIGR